MLSPDMASIANDLRCIIDEFRATELCDEKIAALRSLYLFIFSGEGGGVISDRKRALLSEGGNIISPIINFLQAGGVSYEIQGLGFQLLCIFSDVSEHQAAVSKPECLALAVDLLKASPDPKVKEAVIFLLAHLSGNQGYLTAIFESGCLAPAVDLLRLNVSLAVNNLIVILLARLSINEGFRAAIFESECLAPVVDFLSSGASSEMKSPAICLLNNLSLGNEGRQIAIATSGCLASASAFLSIDSAPSERWRVLYLFNSLVPNKACQSAIITSGCLACILALLDPAVSPAVSKSNLVCILHILSVDARARDAIIAFEGGVNFLQALLLNPIDGVGVGDELISFRQKVAGVLEMLAIVEGVFDLNIRERCSTNDVLNRHEPLVVLNSLINPQHPFCWFFTELIRNVIYPENDFSVLWKLSFSDLDDELLAGCLFILMSSKKGIKTLTELIDGMGDQAVKNRVELCALGLVNRSPRSLWEAVRWRQHKALLHNLVVTAKTARALAPRADEDVVPLVKKAVDVDADLRMLLCDRRMARAEAKDSRMTSGPAGIVTSFLSGSERDLQPKEVVGFVGGFYDPHLAASRPKTPPPAAPEL